MSRSRHRPWRGTPVSPASLCVAVLLFPAIAHALPHDPAVSRTHIAFVEGGQVWVMARGETTATQLTDSPGGKFTPRFSPGGDSLAFAANEAPNQVNLQTLPLSGGKPTQLTFLPSHQNLCQWTADGRLLFYTNALSFVPIEMQLFTVPTTGGLPARLPLAFGSDGALDAAGEWLAYTPQWPTTLMDYWKRYRGGTAPDVWLLNLKTRESRRITTWKGPDRHPMWHGTTLYYVSDEGPEQQLNLWAYDTRSRKKSQVTRLPGYDVRNPSIGPDAIVFEYGPDLYLHDLESGRTSRLEVSGAARGPLRRDVDARRFVTARHGAAEGRLLLEARGDLWLAGTGAQPPRNLTATSGAFEREAAVSPDGRSIAYWSDATGEYQLYVRDHSGRPAAGPLTKFTSGFRGRPAWSGDAKMLAFADQAGAITLFDVASGTQTRADVDPWGEPVELAWSPNGDWLAYTRTGPQRMTAIWRYDVATGRRRQLTADAFNASTPVFDPNGERMFFISYRNFGNALSDWMQQRIVHRATTALMSVRLHEVGDEPWAFERRAVRLAITPGAITALDATHDGNPIYGQTGLGGTSSVRLYDLRAGQERTIVDGTGEVVLSADRSALLVEREGRTLWRSLVDSSEHAIRADSMSVSVDLGAEWRQLFDDTWRLYRDYFYAPKAAPVDWAKMAARYRPLLSRCVTREEVNVVLAELIGESSVGHAYVAAAGDVAPPPAGAGVAMLGADLTIADGAYRIERIQEGAPWDDNVRPPLLDAREGEYLLAVGGVPLTPAKNPQQVLLGRAGKPTTLTVGPHPVRDPSARDIVVLPIADERELRRRAWIERNRRWVDQASDGRIGYVHIPDFNVSGMSDFVRQYYGQIDKDALVIDERWSNGGWVPAHLIELLARTPHDYLAGRYTDHAWPGPRWGGFFGAKALLVNHVTVSAGENFAYTFRKLGLGEVVGERTWGGLTGLNPVPALIDGGAVNVPNAPFYDRGVWQIEGEGLVPDREVAWDPAQADDPQLARAVKGLLAKIAKPYRVPDRPGPGNMGR